MLKLLANVIDSNKMSLTAWRFTISTSRRALWPSLPHMQSRSTFHITISSIEPAVTVLSTHIAPLNLTRTLANVSRSSHVPKSQKTIEQRTKPITNDHDQQDEDNSDDEDEDDSPRSSLQSHLPDVFTFEISLAIDMQSDDIKTCSVEVCSGWMIRMLYNFELVACMSKRARGDSQLKPSGRS